LKKDRTFFLELFTKNAKKQQKNKQLCGLRAAVVIANALLQKVV